MGIRPDGTYRREMHLTFHSSPQVIVIAPNGTALRAHQALISR
jgi:hypothetical protein